jgi:uncharacterized protein YrrD
MKGSEIKGLAVVSIADGERIGTIDRVYVDPHNLSIAGFDVTEQGGFLSPGRTTYIRTDEVHALGPDALTINHGGIFQEPGRTVDRDELFEIDHLRQDEVATEGGEHIGSVADFDFDPQTFAIAEVEINRGLLKSNLIVPATLIMSMGKDLVIVKNQVLESLNQPQPEPESAPEPSPLQSESTNS